MKIPFADQITSIKEDDFLRFYGVMVALFSTLTGLNWLELNMQEVLASGNQAVCWPMFADCNDWHVFSSTEMLVFIYSFIAVSLLSATFFMKSRWVTWGYTLLIILTIAKLAFLAMDFRLRLNQHIMAFWVTMAYLFFPRKKQTLVVLIVLFYFFAGLLKLNHEWLSGAALYGDTWFLQGSLKTIACGYVVVLEILLIWGLLIKKSWINWAVLGQLVLFHLFSYQIVGFFYPLIMLLIITAFPIYWRDRSENPLGRITSLPTSSVLLLIGFCLIQSYSKVLSGDPALTGKGRLFALHMFDSNTVCEPFITFHFANKAPMKANAYLQLAPRIHCDPAVYFSRAKAVCKMYKQKDKSFIDIDLSLKSKRSSELVYQQVIDVKGFCSKDLSYSVFGKNDWILL